MLKSLVPQPQREKVRMAQKGQGKYLPYMDGLRALAAVYVVLHHAFLQIGEAPILAIIQDAGMAAIPVKMLVFLLKHGRLAVDLFIVISGFCLMRPVVYNKGVLRTGALQFFVQRAKRILPPYYLAMGFALLLIFTIIGEKTGTHWDFSLPVTKTAFLTHLLLIQDLFSYTSSKINHAFWSISVEWRIYLLFPLILFFWKSKGPVYTACAAVVLSGLLYVGVMCLELRGNFELATASISPHYLGLFALGALAAELAFSEEGKWVDLRERLPYKLILLFIASVIAYLLRSNIFYSFELAMVAGDILMGIFSGTLLLALASGKLKVILQILSWRPLVFTGTFAYSLYLVHAPLLQVFSQYVTGPLQAPPLTAVLLFVFLALPGIGAISYLFFLLAERPFMKRR
ncbi:MAG: acyltransferase family protein [Adhaeribacter sp.]